MKVFVLGTRGFPEVQGGVEKHCEELYPRLARYGYEITIFTRTPYIPKRKRLYEWNGVKFFHLWAPRIKGLEAIIHTFLGVIIARLYSPDILHIHAIGPSLMVPLAKMLGLKVVITNHGPDYERKKWGKFAKAILKIGELVGVKFADKIIVISRQIKNIVEKKYQRKDLIIIPNGVYLPSISPPGKTLKKYSLKPRKYIFTVCRFVPEKGLHDLITAYKKIENPDFKLVIAGDADHETDYSRNIKKMAKETEGVILTGFISGKPLQELFSNAGLFVLPSYYEGLPIALLEALSYGLPVLVSDIPAHREFPLSEERFFPVGNVDKLREKVIELYRKGITEDEKKLYLNYLKENHSWDKIAEKVSRVYKELVESNQS